jgi:2-polyprenyl-3-methyl-5-hydroxy-6-metoxy-1,4-benzoquinol methylase
VSELDEISRQYLQRPADREVDAVFIDAIAEYIVAKLEGASVIELGLGDRVWTPRLLRRFDRVVSVDGSAELVAAAGAVHTDPRWQGIVSYFEDFTPDQPADVVLATGVLEHVDDPQGVLRRAREWLVDDGELVVTVPNGESLHRQLAKVMGLVDDPTTPGEADVRLGHKHVFTLDRLLSTVEAAGYHVLEVEGLLAKTLPNSLLVACSDAQLRGLVEVGRLLPPRLAGTLYVRARLAAAERA